MTVSLPPTRTSGTERAAIPLIVWALLVLGSLPAAMLIGFGSARYPALPLLAMMGMTGLAVFALAALYPQAAILGLLFAAGFVHVQIGTGTGSPIVASLLAALAIGGGWIFSMIMRRDIRVIRSPVTFPLVGFATVNVLSLLWSRVTLDPRISVPPSFIRVQIAALLVTLLSIAIVFIIGESVRSYRWFALYLGTLFAMGTLHQVLLVTHGPDHLFEGRGLIPMWCIVFAAAQVVINTKLRGGVRVLLIFVVLACLYGLLVHQTWISGWLPATIALLVVLLMRSRLTAILSVFASLIILALLWGTLYQIFTVDKVNQGSLGGNTGRTTLWQRTISTIVPSPWLGSGPAGYALAEVVFYPNDALSSHSNYIDVLAENGVIGMGFWLWFLAAAIRTGLRAQRRLRACGDLAGGGIAVAGIAGTIGITIAMWFGDWVIPFVYNQTIAGFAYTLESWVGIGMMVAVDAMSRETELPQPMTNPRSIGTVALRSR